MVGMNALYLNRMTLKLTRWSELVDAGGERFAKGLTNLKLISQEQWVQNKAKNLGRSLTHGGMIYAYYGLVQLLSHLPNWHEGFFSTGAQLAALWKTSSALAGGYGWSMLGLQLYKMPESQRPISLQTYATFNTIRGTVLGLFIPYMVTTPPGTTGLGYLTRSAPFLISAVTGMVFLKWGQSILKKYPSIGRKLEDFEKMTIRLNEKFDRNLYFFQFRLLGLK